MHIKPTIVVGIILAGMLLQLPAVCIILNGHVDNDTTRGYIGIRYGSTIQQVFIDSPADHAGLLKHDHIVAIDGNYRWTNQDDIDGQPGTYVYLTVIRMVNFGLYSVKTELLIPVLRLPHNQIDWKHSR